MEQGCMEKASAGSFARTTRNADEDEDDWDMTLNGYEPWAGYASATSGMD